MTNNSILRFFTLSAVLACTAPLHAIEVPWTQVCTAANGNRLTIQTTAGERLDGLCVSTTVDQIAVRTSDRGVVNIARTTLARIDMQRTRNAGHHLESLGKGLRWGLGILFSPLAPFGLVVVPPILAYDAIAAPFCWLGDQVEQETSTEEIKVI